MNLNRYLLETATLVGAAALCAFVSNQAASRDRKLALPGSYGDAMKVPARANDTSGSSPAATEPPPATAPRPMGSASPTAVPALPSGARIGAAAAPAAPRGDANRIPAGRLPNSGVPAAPAAQTSADKPEPLGKRFPPHPDKPFVEITGDDTAWLQKHGALILDARRTSVFSEGHIAGSRPFSVWEADIDEKVLGLLNEGRNQQDPIVVYCSGGDCEDSHMLSQKLFGAGFDDVLVYRDGWPDWQKRGGPSRTGAER